jgi:hypothetical protein
MKTTYAITVESICIATGMRILCHLDMNVAMILSINKLNYIDY